MVARHCTMLPLTATRTSQNSSSRMADMDAKDCIGETPWVLAARKRDGTSKYSVSCHILYLLLTTTVCEKLRKEGADVNITDGLMERVGVYGDR